MGDVLKVLVAFAIQMWVAEASDDMRRAETERIQGEIDRVAAQGGGRVVIAKGEHPCGGRRYNPGGELECWRTEDAGSSWRLERRLTERSVRNMNYARQPVDAQPEFYAFWADGNGRDVSPSRLYYCDRELNVQTMPWSCE